MSYKKNKIPVYEIRRTDERKPYLCKLDEINMLDEDMKYIDNVVEKLEEYYDVSHLLEERIYVVSCDRRMRILGITEASKGSESNSIIPYKEIVMFALLTGAHQIMLFHNHPSGELKASEEDDLASQRLSVALTMVEIEFPIHAIIADGDYNIFWEE